MSPKLPFGVASTARDTRAAGPTDADRGCPKCGHGETEVGTISTTGGGLSKPFDVQTDRFRVVSCTSGGSADLYRDDTPGTSDLVDVFLE